MKKLLRGSYTDRQGIWVGELKMHYGQGIWVAVEKTSRDGWMDSKGDHQGRAYQGYYYVDYYYQGWSVQGRCLTLNEDKNGHFTL